MAKRRKSRGVNVAMISPSGGRSHTHTSIEEVDNGFLVHISGESGGKEPKYFSKRLISPTHEGALAIASTHLAGGKSKGRKKSGRKRLAAKTV